MTFFNLWSPQHSLSCKISIRLEDPDDKKPSDWVDDSMMDDPEDKKPENWVWKPRTLT